MITQPFGLAAPAAADPVSDSRRLYVSVNAHHAALMDVLAAKAAPKVTADLIKKYVYAPGNVVGSVWIDRAFSEGQERYRPFSACLDADSALSDLSSRIILSSGGTVDDLTIVSAAANLRQALTACEVAIEKADSGPQIGTRVLRD
ncbi:hypothetical protein [Mesorhizobium sp. YR577]|uniref:hypothetical protein n=1 Tax=Mesorhizobium sp. YR577 TaxID=1884373 RepID=UPI001114A362|nr:hypothetical protein [Mesorhizobium sp. YR577]